MKRIEDPRLFCKNFALILIPLWLGFSLILLYILRTELSADEKIRGIEEKSRVDHIFSAISNNYTFISTDLLTISQMSDMKSLLAGDRTNLHPLEEDLRSFSRIKKLYDQIRYLDENGDEIIRINFNNGESQIVPEANLQNKSERYYFQETLALHEGEIFLSPLDLNVENGKVETPFKPMIRIGTPVFSAEGEKKGIVILNFFGETILRNFPESNSEKEAHFSLLNPKGYWLKSPNPNMEWGFMFEDKKDLTMGNKFADSWQKISASKEGQFQNEYGLFTFRTIYPLSGYQTSSPESEQGEVSEPYFLKLLSHIPPSVLYQNSKNLYKSILWLYILLLSLSMIGSGLFAHMRAIRHKMEEDQQKLIHELQQALEEVKTLQDILPICSFCKNIRNDDGYYEKLEGYFKKASGVKFSHTICPDCMQKEYPDIYADMKKENKI